MLKSHWNLPTTSNTTSPWSLFPSTLLPSPASCSLNPDLSFNLGGFPLFRCLLKCHGAGTYLITYPVIWVGNLYFKSLEDWWILDEFCSSGLDLVGNPKALRWGILICQRQVTQLVLGEGGPTPGIGSTSSRRFWARNIGDVKPMQWYNSQQNVNFSIRARNASNKKMLEKSVTNIVPHTQLYLHSYLQRIWPL